MKKRFESKFRKDPRGCWVWVGSYFTNGYGCFRLTSGSKKAHRISYELYKGPIPEGLLVLHSCDNKGCVNPAHLSLGTHQENMDDGRIRGRFPRGPRPNDPRYKRNEDHPNAKLNNQEIRDCYLYHWQGVQPVVLAVHYGISKSTMSAILRGKTHQSLYLERPYQNS